MTEYERLLEEFSEAHPYLVVSMSGPWRNHDRTLVDEPWLCNFKNASMGFQPVHPGSSGTTMLEALKAGIDFIAANPDKAHDYHEPEEDVIGVAPGR